MILAGQLLSYSLGSAALTSLPPLHIQVQANHKSQPYSSDDILKRYLSHLQLKVCEQQEKRQNLCLKLPSTMNKRYLHNQCPGNMFSVLPFILKSSEKPCCFYSFVPQLSTHSAQEHQELQCIIMRRGRGVRRMKRQGEIQRHCPWQALYQPYREYAYMTWDFVALVFVVFGVFFVVVVVFVCFFCFVVLIKKK